MTKKLNVLRHYPLSLCLIALVIYLSLFRPPQVPVVKDIVGFDKLVHVGMYMMISLSLWLEFFRKYRGENVKPLMHAWIGACVCPILLGGTLELIQAYATTYRGGDWFDFLANSVGVALATLIVMWQKKRISC